MAESPQHVLDFLNDLAARSKPSAAKELQAVRDFAHREDGHEDLQTWDIPYYSEKLRQQRYSISQEELKPYFPQPQVVSGLFSIVERLYGLNISEISGIDTWHEDVRFYRIHDADGELRGEFYLDLYTDPGYARALLEFVTEGTIARIQAETSIGRSNPPIPASSADKTMRSGG